ncbi:ion channel [Methylocapsa acidiphila]|uniref:ion channel n=1 Tax=Methylocapsa acidiphila TaxID=133552 RepID=UPI00041FAA40|nr:ion channel [Methylocapsa acidiphila]
MRERFFNVSAKARALHRLGQRWRGRKLGWFMEKKRELDDRDSTMRIGAFGGNDLIKRGVSRYDLRDPYHIAIDLSWRGFALAFLALDLCINLFFASLYVASPGCIANARPGSFADAFFFSVETMATVGYGVMAPATLYGHAVSALEIVCGMVFTAIMTGLLFVRFSKPRPKILFADRVVVTTHNCAPTLMVRIANGRLTLLTHASARLGLLLYEENAEGLTFRRVHDLGLANASIPLFPLTWTIMHEIDESSPLKGYDAEALAVRGAQLFLTVEARDHALSAFVHDVRIYSHEAILFGSHYADAITFDDRKLPIADLSRLSLLEADISHAE